MVCKRHRIHPFLELLDGPNATCYVYVYDDSTTRTELLLNCDPLQITVHARLLGHSVLPRSAGRLEPERVNKDRNVRIMIILAKLFFFLVCQQILGNLFISACGFCSVVSARDKSLAVVITAIGSYRSDWDNSQEMFIVFVALTDMRPTSHSL